MINTLIEAVNIAKNRSKKRNFIQSIELIVTLRGIDVKKPENRIIAKVELPHEIVKRKTRVCVIANGDLALKAKDAQADGVISRQDLEKLKDDRKMVKKIANDYDFFLAAVDLMPMVGKILGPVLGPRGKMPDPVTPSSDIGKQIESLKRSVLIKMRAGPQIQCIVGSEDMNAKDVAENIMAVINFIDKRFPLATHMSNIYIKTTMGPIVKVQTSIR
jgi:large subunit ribosomal protein L1